MNYVKGYQINTTGLSEGLTIPTGFGIAVVIAVEASVNDDSGDFAKLEVQLCTGKTTTFDDVIKQNDDLMAQGFEANGNTKSYTLVTADLNSGVRTLVNNKVKPDLEAAYGVGNVVEL